MARAVATEAGVVIAVMVAADAGAAIIAATAAAEAMADTTAAVAMADARRRAANSSRATAVATVVAIAAATRVAVVAIPVATAVAIPAAAAATKRPRAMTKPSKRQRHQLLKRRSNRTRIIASLVSSCDGCPALNRLHLDLGIHSQIGTSLSWPGLLSRVPASFLRGRVFAC